MTSVKSSGSRSRHPERSEGTMAVGGELAHATNFLGRPWRQQAGRPPGKRGFAALSMTRNARVGTCRAFSLIEVIVAVALFAGTVTVILALLPGLTRRGVETADRLVAQRLPDALQVELQRLATAGFEALAGQTPSMGMPPVNGLAFVATREGTRLHSRDVQSPATGRIADAEQYFLIECWRFSDGPLAYDPAQSALALVVRVSWPYRQPGSSAPTAPEQRHELMFTAGVNR